MSMAARRISSWLLCPNQSPLLKDLSQRVLPSLAISFASRYNFHGSGLRTQKNEPISTNQDNVPQCSTEIGSSSVKLSEVASRLKTSSRHDMAMVFTCRVCETRSVKTACRESYEKGVVVVRCGGCDNLHLIADNLGWFGEPKSVEDFLAARGEDVKRGTSDSFGLTLEDLAGTTNN